MVKGPTGCGLQEEDINGKGSHWLWSTRAAMFLILIN